MVILLALTSNKGAFDFQFEVNPNGDKLFETVLRKSQQWADSEQMMYVVGATKALELEGIRKIVPDHFCWCLSWGAGWQFEEVTNMG